MSRLYEDHIAQQFAFLIELDELKSIMRQSPLINQSRKENSAEHSWHLSMFALILSSHARDTVDTLHVVKLLLVHDIVEIDAGDHPIHSIGESDVLVAQAEQLAAERIFGLLPKQQGRKMLELWNEFEAAETPEAIFAKSLDRLQPLLINTLSNGGTWAEAGVTQEQVMERYGPVIERGSPILWDVASKRVCEYFETLERE
ncbi:HD domain-containing protein [Pseudomonas atacamensis]|uniref:HD domain-containing protein n=1 Tax=Pseudomonas atacamensis TaxID=2565368 RepID=UPI001FAD5649|nr:HD domain-containing protein [Pseudomonas atacamensis]MCI9875497.1 HD domain-containing protein [Pseudomonas atacamensis]